MLRGSHTHGAPSAPSSACPTCGTSPMPCDCSQYNAYRAWAVVNPGAHSQGMFRCERPQHGGWTWGPHGESMRVPSEPVGDA